MSQGSLLTASLRLRKCVDEERANGPGWVAPDRVSAEKALLEALAEDVIRRSLSPDMQEAVAAHLDREARRTPVVIRAPERHVPAALRPRRHPLL